MLWNRGFMFLLCNKVFSLKKYPKKYTIYIRIQILRYLIISANIICCCSRTECCCMVVIILLHYTTEECHTLSGEKFTLLSTLIQNETTTGGVTMATRYYSAKICLHWKIFSSKLFALSRTENRDMTQFKSVGI